MTRRRPVYHLTASDGWVNDPHGVTFRDGRVDVFYQHVPGSTGWRPDCHWGHATSTDLVRWEERPPALRPGDGDDGCWTGSLVLDGDVPTVFYTAVSGPDRAIGTVRVAHPADSSWDAWRKGPVVVRLPDGVEAVGFRDPFVLRDRGGWRMLLGAGLTGGVAAVLSFSSVDLASWSYAGILAQRASSERDPTWTGSMWECPQLVSVDGQDLLVVSVWHEEALHHVACARGSYEAGRFDVAGWQRLTYGPSYYATTTFRDDEGRCGVMHWLREVGGPPDAWTGALSVPHLLGLRDGSVVLRPHPRVIAAGQGAADGGRAVPAGTTLALPSWHCALLVEPGDGAVTVRLLTAQQEMPVLAVTHDPAGGTLRVSTGQGPASEWTMPAGDRPVDLWVLLDGCLAEILAGDSGVLAVPLAAAADAPTPVLAAVTGCRVTVRQLDAPA